MARTLQWTGVLFFAYGMGAGADAALSQLGNFALVSSTSRIEFAILVIVLGLGVLIWDKQQQAANSDGGPADV